MNTQTQIPRADIVAAQVTQPKPFTDSVAMNEELAKPENLGEVLGKFKAYDSQLPVAEITGTRIVKCLYQVSPKTGRKVQENSYVRLPTKHLTEEHVVSRIAELSPYVLVWLQGLEDIAIRDLHKKGGLTVYTEGLSLDKVIEALEVSSQGSRLNKESIEAWFTLEVEPNLAELFADKMGIDEEASEAELEKLELVLAAYKAKFASLASGKTFIKEDDCLAMIKVVEEAGADETLIGTRFVARLNKMQERTDNLLMSL